MLTQERQIMLPCRLERTSSWRLGEGVGGEPGDGSQNTEGVLCSVTTYNVTLDKSISFPPPTNEFIYLWIKKKGGVDYSSYEISSFWESNENHTWITMILVCKQWVIKIKWKYENPL